MRYVFDLRDEDLFWCTADIGWVTGHSYVVYGPLANGATSLCTRRTELPEPDRFWRIVAEVSGSLSFTSAHRHSCRSMKWGTEWPKNHD